MSELAFLKAFGWWGAFLVALIAFSYRMLGTLHKDEGRGRWVAWLRHDRFARRYREILDAALNWSDAKLSPEFSQDPTDREGNRKTEPARAWSHRLLDLCLLLAVAYPVLAVLLDWAVTGDTGRFGTLEVVPAESVWWKRWLPVALLALALISGFVAQRAQSRRGQQYLQFFALALAFAFAFAVASAVAGKVAGVVALVVAFAVAFSVAFSVAFALAVAVAFALAGAVALVFTGSGHPLAWANALEGTYKRKFAGAFAGAFAVSGAVAVAFAGAVPVAVAGAVAVGFAGAAVEDWLGGILSARRPVLLAFTLFLFAAACVLLLWAEPDLSADVRTAVLLLSFLPLLNAWADFASVGLTRWRLRCGVQGHLIGNAVTDGLAAVALLIVLALATVATIHFVRPGGSGPLIELTDLFTDLAENPGHYWWLAFTLFSTLLPTLLHLCIGAFAVFTLVSGWLGRPIAAGLMMGDSPEGRAAALALTVAAALAVWVPCFLLWHALTLGGGWLLAALLSACEWFHGLLSAWFPVNPAA